MARLNLPTDALARADAAIDRIRAARMAVKYYLPGPCANCGHPAGWHGRRISRAAALVCDHCGGEVLSSAEVAADEDRGLAPMRPAASLKAQPAPPAKADVPATALRLAPLWRGW